MPYFIDSKMYMLPSPKSGGGIQTRMSGLLGKLFLCATQNQSVSHNWEYLRFIYEV